MADRGIERQIAASFEFTMTATPGSVVDVFHDDQAALADWLASKPNASPHSIRAYRQAVAHLWHWLEAQAPEHTVAPNALITLNRTQALAYQRHLFAERIGPTQRPLSAKTIKHRLVILSSMYAYWLKPRDGGRSIVSHNPFDGLASHIDAGGHANTGSNRSLSAQEQEVVEAAIETLPRQTPKDARHYRRARLIWLLASRLALRRSEIAGLKVNDFSLSASGHWKIEIKGKGRKENQNGDVIVVPDFLMTEIRKYRESFGLPPHLLPSDSSPLIRHVSERHRYPGLTDTHVARIMKEIFLAAAQRAEIVLNNPHMAKRLKSASIHWGRHTWFMNALQKHDIRLVSTAGRHRDIRTTMKNYVGTSETELATVMSTGRDMPERSTDSD